MPVSVCSTVQRTQCYGLSNTIQAPSLAQLQSATSSSQHWVLRVWTRFFNQQAQAQSWLQTTAPRSSRA
jgi:hypothetical protein